MGISTNPGITILLDASIRRGPVRCASPDGAYQPSTDGDIGFERLPSGSVYDETAAAAKSCIVLNPRLEGGPHTPRPPPRSLT
jgi:hypothetical protein